MDSSDGQAPNEADFFLIFSVLRESKAIISEGFNRRVAQKLMKLVDDRRLASPSMLEMLGQVSMDSMNIMSEGIEGRPKLRDLRGRTPPPAIDGEDDNER